MQNQLEYERLRREKLEFQLDHSRQELEKAIKSLRDYETKVVVLERYIQHVNKTESKTNKKGAKLPHQTSLLSAGKSVRSKSSLSKASKEENKSAIDRKSSKISNFSESTYKSAASKNNSYLNVRFEI